MTRLEKTGLSPITDVPDTVRDFFSYDRFQILWRDLCPTGGQTFFRPIYRGAFLGIRNLRGEMADGRRATANLAFLADAEEETDLRRIALSVLGDFPSFNRKILSWLSVDSTFGYRINAEAFEGWMASARESGCLRRLAAPKSPAAKLLLWMQRVEEPRFESDLLRLAVYTSTWKAAAAALGGGLAWKLKHPCALTPEEFDTIFSAQAPLWELTAES